MSHFVVDCSIAAAWCFEDEAEAATDALLDRLKADGASAPAIWSFEIANVLLQAEHRGRISAAVVNHRLALLDQLSIIIDPAGGLHTGVAILALARAHRLTAYDAAYLELAIRLGVPLATKDKALVHACRAVGVEVLP